MYACAGGTGRDGTTVERRNTKTHERTHDGATWTTTTTITLMRAIFDVLFPSSPFGSFSVVLVPPEHAGLDQLPTGRSEATAEMSFILLRAQVNRIMCVSPAPTNKTFSYWFTSWFVRSFVRSLRNAPRLVDGDEDDRIDS